MSEKFLVFLVIDERVITTDLDRAGYRKSGVSIKPARSFQEANQILTDHEVDAIIFNYDYKEVDAIHACHHFKNQQDTMDIPVVFTSVQGRPGKLKECEKAGMDLFIEQPVPKQQLIEKIRALLEQQTRTTERVHIEGGVEFDYEGKRITCDIGDLSISGMLILTDLDLNTGVDIDMSFTLPGYKKPVEAKGAIVRLIEERKGNKKEQGYGIRFDDFKGDGQKRLERYVSKSASSDPRLAYYL